MSADRHAATSPRAAEQAAGGGGYGWTPEPSFTDGLLGPPLRAILAGLAAHRVLDLGCGNGGLCALLHAAGHEVVGIDRDPHGVELAKAACRQVPFYRFALDSDPGELLMLEDRFDAVISTEVVEHLYAPHELPIYAACALKPGGHLVVSTPYHGYWKNLALALGGKWDRHHTALWHGGHVKFWSRATLTRLLCDHGFDVIAFRGVGRLPLLWMSMILVARKR